jgi:Acyl-CoA reductase (LuxC)
MNSAVTIEKKAASDAAAAVSAPFFARGALIEGNDAVHRSRDLGVNFATPKINLDRIVHPRTEVPPLLNVPLAEIIDFLVETGQRIVDPNNAFVQDCVERMCSTHILPRGVLENQIKGAAAYLDKRLLNTVVEQNFPDPKALDEWVPHQDYTGRRSFVRAFAPRLVHVLPGNSPGVAVKSIAQGAMVKAINLFKMSSSDPFTTVAILRTMADIDPSHAIVDVGSVLARRRRFGGTGAVPPAIFRQDRRLGRRRCDQQCHQVFGAGFSARFIRSENVDFHGRQGSIRF